MPQRRTSIKALRVSHKRHMQNLDYKTDLRKTVKEFRNLITAKNKDEAKKTLSSLYKKLDKGTKKDLLHKNTVARRKSSFSKLLASIV